MAKLNGTKKTIMDFKQNKNNNIIGSSSWNEMKADLKSIREVF